MKVAVDYATLLDCLSSSREGLVLMAFLIRKTWQFRIAEFQIIRMIRIYQSRSPDLGANSTAIVWNNVDKLVSDGRFGSQRSDLVEYEVLRESLTCPGRRNQRDEGRQKIGHPVNAIHRLSRSLAYTRIESLMELLKELLYI